MAVIEGRLNAEGKRFVIVASRWNDLVTAKLVEGAERAFRMHGLKEGPEVVWVPGAWELPVAVANVLEQPVAGIVCAGCILQGATLHAAQLSNVVAATLADLGMRTGIPITWAVLTCVTQEEALERAGMKLGNKGEEAAKAAIEMASVKEQIR